MKRKIFLSLRVINEEYEYTCQSVHDIPAKTFAAVQKFAEEYASEFYTSVHKSEKVGNFYEFDGGSVAVKVAHVDIITDEEYKVLEKFLNK